MAQPTVRSRPTTPAAVCAAVYHRVSSEEQVEGYSLDAQQRATTDRGGYYYIHEDDRGWVVCLPRSERAGAGRPSRSRRWRG